MQREVILHAGLHKTATRFLQKSVFLHLDQEAFEYNPRPLIKLLERRIRHPDDTRVKTEFEEEARRKLSADERTLLLSLPEISGSMYNNHLDYDANLDLIREWFPQARIVLFVRNQADWLHSAYRQSLQKGRSGPIETFLNYYDGDFQPRRCQRMDGMRTLDPFNLRFLEMYRGYVEAFGQENVYLFRYEDFKSNRDVVVSRLSDALAVERLPIQRPRRVRNRAFSALAIRLFCPGFRLPGRRPKPTPRRAPPLVRKVSPLRTLRFLRRRFIQKVFDRIVYVDWDLLARHGMRERIEAHYRRENEEIERAATAVLRHGPGAGEAADDFVRHTREGGYPEHQDPGFPPSQV